jgi:5-methylcytosine-specific restriction enzyme A
MTERLRGRAGIAQRLRRLRKEPLCRDCKSAGLIRAATVPDHIVPLSQGGLDIDENIRCLCEPCHRLRTAEQFGRKIKRPTGVDGWPAE